MGFPSYGITISQDHQAQTVYLSGEIDFAATLQINPILERVSKECTNLQFDLSKVVFIDSEGLKTLITTFQNIYTNGGQATITKCSERALRTIHLAGIEDTLKITPAES